MKLYTVWSGEYSDRCMHAIFESEEKANHYANVYGKINGYDDYYVIEYELYDEKFDLNIKANKFYHCTIYIKDEWNYDKTEIFSHKGDIDSDEMWDSFMEEYGIESYDDLDPKVYSDKIIGNVDDVEDKHCVPMEYLVDNRESFVDYPEETWHENYITTYSQRGYHHARKIAIEQYQKYTQQELEDGLI